MRVVLDANVLVSALISAAGPPREIVRAWTDERIELVVSATLLDELKDVLTRSRFRRWVSAEVAAEFITGLAQDALLIDDAASQQLVLADPDDDYLVALARAAAADYLISGDRHLLALADPVPPVLTPRQFCELLGS